MSDVPASVTNFTLVERKRFWTKVLVGNGCWEWTGAKSKGQYGNFAAQARNWCAHRISYEMLVGPIPPRYEIDHLCLNKGCVNPAHLEPVPYDGRENTRRYQAAKTHCPRGHAYTDENTYLDRGNRRSCKACRRVALAAFEARNPGRRKKYGRRAA